MFNKKIIICVEVYDFDIDHHSHPQIFVRGVVLLDNEGDYSKAKRIINRTNEKFDGDEDEWAEYIHNALEKNNIKSSVYHGNDTGTLCLYREVFIESRSSDVKRIRENNKAKNSQKEKK